MIVGPVDGLENNCDLYDECDMTGTCCESIEETVLPDIDCDDVGCGCVSVLIDTVLEMADDCWTIGLVSRITEECEDGLIMLTKLRVLGFVTELEVLTNHLDDEKVDGEPIGVDELEDGSDGDPGALDELEDRTDEESVNLDELDEEMDEEPVGVDEMDEELEKEPVDLGELDDEINDGSDGEPVGVDELIDGSDDRSDEESVNLDELDKELDEELDDEPVGVGELDDGSDRSDEEPVGADEPVDETVDEPLLIGLDDWVSLLELIMEELTVSDTSGI